MKQKIIIANWKMKLNIKESLELAREYAQKFADEAATGGKEIAVCPANIALREAKDIFAPSAVKIGAQNVFWEEQGAFTGEISVTMLEEAGCQYVIIGHSERRQYLLENYEMAHLKLKTVLDHSNIIPIVCVGESLKEKESDRRDYVIIDQIQQTFGGVQILSQQQVIIAYEPIWAIGTGQAIKPADADTMHEIIHAALVDLFGIDVINKQFRIIYGGSVDSANVSDFSQLDNIDGLLVGGASLKAEDFYKIVKGI